MKKWIVPAICAAGLWVVACEEPRQRSRASGNNDTTSGSSSSGASSSGASSSSSGAGGSTGSSSGAGGMDVTSSSSSSGSASSSSGSGSSSASSSSSSSSGGQCKTFPDLLNDGGYELGLNGGAWTETSTNFGTPLCDASCQPATPVGSGPHGGTFWAWFGGANAAEDATTSQSVTIPDLGTATLSFYLEVPSACANATDYFEVTIDGTQLLKIAGNGAECVGAVGYVLKTIKLNAAYSDGQSHTIEFHAVTAPDPAMMKTTNFFVDDVKLAITCP